MSNPARKTNIEDRGSKIDDRHPAIFDPRSSIFDPPSSILCPRSSDAAFTLTELLVVIALIVLFVTMALPAFNLISGGKSISAAENQLSALLGRARTEAIGLQTPRGIAFYTDAATGRTAMALVQQTSAVTYVPAIVAYPVGTYVVYSGKYFVSRTDLAVGTPAPTGAYTDPNWSPTDQFAVDVTADNVSVFLPAGVGVQLLNNNLIGAITSNRYISYGAILFDGSGSVLSTQTSIAAGGIIGTRANLLTSPGYSVPKIGGPIVYSSLGFVLYDLGTYNGQGTVNAIQSVLNAASPATINYIDSAQESWLDSNSTPLLINRYNGTLVRGE